MVSKVIIGLMTLTLASSGTEMASNSILANLLDKAGQGCDLIFLPDDNGSTFSVPDIHEIFEQYGSAVTDVEQLSHGTFTSDNKCPQVILPTSNSERLVSVAKLMSKTRILASLAVINPEPATLDVAYVIQKELPKLTFNVHAYTLKEDGMYEVTSLLVSDNAEWNTIRVTYRNYNYWIMSNPDGTFCGPDYNVLKEISRKTGIEYKFQKGKSFSGMIQEVENGTADMAISQATYSHDRYNRAGDVSVPYRENSFHILTRIPDKVSAIWTLTYSFDIPTWTMLGVSLLVMSAFLEISNHFPVSYFTPGRPVSAFDNFIICTSCLLSESATPETFRARLYSRYMTLLLFVWLIAAILLSMAYKSTLLASLISVEREDAVDTFQDLIDKDILIVMYNGLIFIDLMRESPRPVVREAYQKCLVDKNGFYSGKMPAYMNELLDAGKAVTIGSKEYNVGSLTGRKHLFMGGEKLGHSFVGTHFVRRFPWKDQFNDVVMHLTEGGLINKDMADVGFIEERPERDYERNNHVDLEKQLTQTHFSLTWIMLSLGLAAGIIAFLLELMHDHRLKRQKVSKKQTYEKCLKIFVY